MNEEVNKYVKVSDNILLSEMKPLRKLLHYLSNEVPVDDLSDINQLIYLQEIGKVASSTINKILSN